MAKLPYEHPLKKYVWGEEFCLRDPKNRVILRLQMMKRGYGYNIEQARFIEFLEKLLNGQAWVEKQEGKEAEVHYMGGFEPKEIVRPVYVPPVVAVSDPVYGDVATPPTIEQFELNPTMPIPGHGAVVEQPVLPPTVFEQTDDEDEFVPTLGGDKALKTRLDKRPRGRPRKGT